MESNEIKEGRVKKYIKENFTPIMIGLSIGLIYCETLQIVDDIITKIAILKNK